MTGKPLYKNKPFSVRLCPMSKRESLSFSAPKWLGARPSLGARAILPGDAGDLVANAKRCGYIAFNYDNDGHNFGMRQRHVG